MAITVSMHGMENILLTL